MGDFFLTAFDDGDFPQLMPWMVIVVISVIVFNLLADVAYAWLDPRIRLTDLRHDMSELLEPGASSPTTTTSRPMPVVDGPDLDDSEGLVESVSPRRMALRRFRRHKVAMVCPGDRRDPRPGRDLRAVHRPLRGDPAAADAITRQDDARARRAAGLVRHRRRSAATSTRGSSTVGRVSLFIGLSWRSSRASSARSSVRSPATAAAGSTTS